MSAVQISPPTAPFPVSDALNAQRLEHAHGHVTNHKTSTSTSNNLPLKHIPGEPTVILNSAKVHSFLICEIETPLLDELYSNLWLVARRSGRSIDPLYQQVVKGRNIVPTEDPKLHLVWAHDKIYLKPIPMCLLNHDFWTAYLPIENSSSSNSTTQSMHTTLDRAIALGFLRSYALLVKHRLDFILAQENHLIPDEVDWGKWSKFIAHFRNIEDHEVAKRYHYGQLRLSRLNWAVRIFRPHCASTSWFYELPHWSTELYIQWAIAPLLFAFASLSVALSSMQVVLTVPGDGLDFAGLGASASGLRIVRRAFWVSSMLILFSLGVIWVLLIIIPLSVLGWQLSWGYRNRGKEVAADTS